MLDRLWLKHSNGHFGFSTQQQIWLGCNANYTNFGEKVGWHKDDCWLDYDRHLLISWPSCLILGFTLGNRPLHIQCSYPYANPKTAGMQQGFFYDFSNYGSYARLTDDGLTQWHPAFLELADNLDGCAEKYKSFCSRYKPRAKSDRRSHWGCNLLPKILKLKPQQESRGQMLLPWVQRAQTLDLDDIVTAALDFVRANSYAYEVALEKFY